jgi:hypothetical protein
MSSFRTGLSAVSCALLLLAAGCGGGDGTVKVEGVVFFDGKPLSRALVLFMPEGTGGRDASGTTDTGGKFRLSALPGNYKVAIQYSEEVVPPADLKTPVEIQKGFARSKPPAPSLTLPPTYSQPDKTVLRQRVPAEGAVKFDLHPDGRAPGR